MIPENFDLPAGRPVELHFPDIAANLHAVGPGIHAQCASDSAGDADESLHPTEIVRRAEGDQAPQACRGIDMREIAMDHDVGLGTDELQDHPGQFPITYEQVRASTEELMRDVVRIEKIQEIGKTFVLLDAEQVRGTADAQRSQLGKSSAVLQLHVELRKLGNDVRIKNAHEVSNAPFQAKR